MSYWKSKVIPKLKKLFDKSGKKKAGASEACNLFNSSKESFEKEIGEKTTDLHPKIIEIYRSSTVIAKKLLKEPNEAAVKENPDAAQNVLQELAKAGFPGAQGLSDSASKYGPALLPGPIVYLFQKTSTFLVEEPLAEPQHGTREIAIEETTAEDKTKELEALPEGEVVNPPQPPPIEPVALVQKHSAPSEEKKEVIPVIVAAEKEESIPVIEVKKEEVAPIEVKQAEVAPIETKKEEVSPNVAKKEVTPIEAKKEEVASSKEDKKEAVASAKEVATPSVDKKEEKATPIEGTKEEVTIITNVEEKGEKPTL